MNRFILYYFFKFYRLILGLGLPWIVILTGCLLTRPAYSQDVLWGMTYNGGPKGAGTIFSIKSNGDDFTLHQAFSLDSNGANPFGNLIESRDGNFYGMTNSGGNIGGTIFRIAADGTDLRVIKRFDYCSMEGSHPYGSLIEGSDGFFYGMAQGGGNNCENGWGYGTIFKINSDGSIFTTLKRFNGYDGSQPYGSLVEGSDGYLYGMAMYGGDYSQDEYTYGTIFKIAADGTDFTVLRSFNGSDGTRPYGSLVEGSDGFFYGTTSEGGMYGGGTIFKINANGKDFTILKSFNRTDGAYPRGDLFEGKDGYLYGTTQLGGNISQNLLGDGTIFKINTDGSGFMVLKKFNPSTDGAYSWGSLIEGSDGSLYGMAAGGGNLSQNPYPGDGTIFKINPDGSGFTVLRSFNAPTDGSIPLGSLIIQKGKTPPAATRVNFQSKWPTPPQGWLKDYGLPFGEHSVADSSLIYGWKRRDNHQAIDLSVIGTFSGNPGNGRHRLSPSDILLATLIHMQGNDVKNFRGTPVESYWEMAVENGEYEVTVSVGDGSVYTYTDPEYHSVNVEGIAAITRFIPQGTQGSLSRFKQATVKVTVNDGYLTLDADGGTNTKINYAIIQPLFSPAAVASKQVAIGELSASVNTVQAFPNPFSDRLTLDVKDYSGEVTVTLQDLMGNTLLKTQQQAKTTEFTLDLSRVDLKTGMYLIKITDQNGINKIIKISKK